LLNSLKNAELRGSGQFWDAVMSVLISTKVLSEPSAATVSRGGFRPLAAVRPKSAGAAKADIRITSPLLLDFDFIEKF
jgi:hypothetical protein